MKKIKKQPKKETPKFRVDLKGVGFSDCIGFYSKTKRESDDALELALHIVQQMAKNWSENAPIMRYEIGLACIASCKFSENLTKKELETIKKDFKIIKKHLIKRWKER